MIPPHQSGSAIHLGCCWHFIQEHLDFIHHASWHSRLFDRRSFHPSCIRWIHSVILSGWQDGRWIGWLGGRHQPPHAELAFGHLCMSQELLEQQQRPVLCSSHPSMSGGQHCLVICVVGHHGSAAALLLGQAAASSCRAWHSAIHCIWWTGIIWCGRWWWR